VEGRPRVRVIDNPRRITPCGLNAAIRASSGEVIVRMDAHVHYPPWYVSRLVAALEESGVESVGGMIETIPANDSATAGAIAVGMAHPFGVGPSRFRVGTGQRRFVDHLPFFCCRRDIFERIGLFDEELLRNQDGELSSRLRRQGGRILLVPEVVSYYYARETLGKLARTLYQYGYFKPLSARKVGRIMTVRQLVPPAFVAALAASAAMSLVSAMAAAVFLGIVAVYALAVVGCCAAAARRHRPGVALALAAVFPIMHVTYGFGFLRRSAELALRPGARVGDGELLPLSR
jgi:hypothetical protein